MAKDKLTEYSATNASNDVIGDISVAEGMLPSAVNNALREQMTHLKNFSDGTDAIDALAVDNLKLDGNTISSTDTNGDISLSPNGTGDVVVASDNLLISNVGGVGVNSTDNIFINATNTGIKLLDDEASVIPCQSGGSNNDNALDLGFSTVRWKDLYLSGSAYIGGTAAANALDDYEEGSWTGTLTGAVAPSSSQTATGSYTKIGRLVTVNISFSAKNTSGASGALEVRGLPFSISDQGWGSYLSYNTANTASASIEAVAWANSGTKIIFYDWADSGVWNQTTITAGSDRYLFVSITYATT